MSNIIEVDPHRGKLIEFNIEIEGFNYDEIDGKFRIIDGDIEYGFPTSFKENHKIEVTIPPLNNIFSNNKKKSLKAKLEIMTDCQYFSPWDGKLKFIESKSVKVSLNKKSKPKVKVKTEMEDQDVNEEVEVIVDDPEEEVSIPKPSSKDKKKKESSMMDESSRDEYLEKLKQIDEKGIRNYMTKAGTKSLTVQNIIMEQAESNCKDPSNKFELLKSVVKVMKKIRNPDRMEIK